MMDIKEMDKVTPIREKSSCLLGGPRFAGTDSYSRRAFFGKAGAGAFLAGASGLLSLALPELFRHSPDSQPVIINVCQY